MPLDPALDGLLQLMAQMNRPSLVNGTVEQARAGFAMMTAGTRLPENLPVIASREDVTVAGVPCRVYQPVGDPIGTVLFFHGGGYVIGSIETHEDQASLICRDTQVTVVSVEYRLAPENPWPAGVEDCLAVAKEVIATYPGPHAVAGDSAGGNFSAVTAIALRDAGITLDAQLLIYPGTDFDPDADHASRVENAEGYFLTAADMLWFLEQYVPAGADIHDPRLSPLHADLTGLAPAVVGTAEFDPLRDEGNAYAAALEKAGVTVVAHQYPGMIHGFFGLGLVSPAAAAHTKELCLDLKALLEAARA